MQYLIYAWDANDAGATDRRMATRPDHLAGARELKEKGHFIIGGAMLDEQGQMRGSMMVVEFDKEEDFQAWMDTEPYIVKGVWKKIEVHPFRVAQV